jgi:O-antigen/teichoic acid export membrane protein
VKLPRTAGPVWLAAGLVLGGAGAYGYLALAGRAMGPQRFASLGVLWTVVNIVGPGLFAPMELEMSRALAHRNGLGQGGLPLYTQALRVTLACLAGAAVVLAVAAPFVTGPLYDGSVLLLLWTLLSTGLIALASLSRGVFASTGRLTRYGVQLVVEGAVRVLLAAAALVAGIRSPDAFGGFLVVALAVAVLVTFRGPRPFLAPGPPADARELTTRLALLLGTSLLSYGLVNAGPILVKLLAGPGEQRAAGVFLSGLQVARVPLFGFAAVSVVMLPRLAAAYAARDLDRYRRTLALELGLVAGVSAAGVAGSAALGPWVVRSFFGPEFVLGRVDLTLLALGSGLYMLGLALGQALLAVESHAAGLKGWAVGIVGLAAVTAAVPGLELRVAWGFVGGSAAAVLAMAWLLRARLRQVAAAGLGRSSQARR